jgi:hypothetical protein
MPAPARTRARPPIRIYCRWVPRGWPGGGAGRCRFQTGTLPAEHMVVRSPAGGFVSIISINQRLLWPPWGSEPPGRSPLSVGATYMVQMTPDEPPQHSAAELARLLTDAALANPTLLNRGQALRATRLSQHTAALAPTMPSPAPLHSRSDTDEYLEQLASIAVSSAQRAEDALQSIGRNGKASRRTIATVTGIGALGVLVGIVGVADKRLTDQADARVTQVVGEVRILADMQQQTSGQVALLRARAAARPADAASTPPGTGAPPSGGAPAQVADQHPDTRDQTAEHPVPDAATASSEGKPVAAPGAASAPVAVSPTQPYGVHSLALAELPSSPGNVEMPSNEGVTTPAVASTPVAALPTQPYGFHPVVPVALPAWSANVPPPPGASPRVVQHVAPVRRVARSRGGASGNPVRDVRNFVVAVGDGVRAFFVR